MEGHVGRVGRGCGVGRPALAAAGAGGQKEAGVADREPGAAAETVDEALQPAIGAPGGQEGALDGGGVVQQPLRSGRGRGRLGVEALDDGVGDAAHEAAGGLGVGGHEDPQAQLWGGDQLGAEVQRPAVAAVTEVAAGQGVFEHAVVPGAHAGRGLQQGGAEVLGDGRAVDGASVRGPVAQDRHQIAPHVRAGGRAGQGGAGLSGELRRLGHEARSGPAEALGDIGGQVGIHRRGQVRRGRIRLAQGGAGQAERQEHFDLGQRLGRLAGDLAQGLAGQRGGVGGVGRDLAGFAHAPGALLAEIGLQRPDQGRIALDDLAEAAFFEAGALAQKVLQPNRLDEGLVGDLVALAQVLVDRGVQAHVPGLDLAQHPDPGEALGDRPQPEQGAVRIDRAHRREPVDAISLVQQHLAVLDHGHHSPGDMVAAHGLGGEAVHEGFELGRRQRLAGGQPHPRVRRRGGGKGRRFRRGAPGGRDMRMDARRPRRTRAHEGDRRHRGQKAARPPRHTGPPAQVPRGF